MRTLWLLIGRLAYWCGKPIIALMVKDTRRTRVLVIHNDAVLLLQNWLGDGSWVLPGGGLHAGEDAEAGALRELREEAGLNLQPGALSFVGSHTYKDKTFAFSYELFTVVLDERPVIRSQPFEIAACRWVPRSELATYKLAREVESALAAWPV